MHGDAQQAAQRYYEQLRAALEEPEPGDLAGADLAEFEARAAELLERILRDYAAPGVTPEIRAEAERVVAQFMRGRAGRHEIKVEQLSRIQDRIEAAIPTLFPDGLPRLGGRPLVRPLRTGQLNAVCTLTPGRSDAYLVLVEDQMEEFWRKLSAAVAWAIPRGPVHDGHLRDYQLGVSGVTERIESDPDVLARFVDAITGYAVTGRFDRTESYAMLPPGYLNFANMLGQSLENFVIGHEYGHILFGHLHKTAPSRGVLPIDDVSTLTYSWKQELEADFIGMGLAINCADAYPVELSFLGISLFFDALDVMDRAVSLLETGDENVRQLGSHPPSYLRRRRMRESLEQLARVDGTDEREKAERFRAALKNAEIQADVVRLLWERTRPRLLELRERGVRPARTWRTIAKEAPTLDPPLDPGSLHPDEAASHYYRNLLARTDALLGARARVDPAALGTELDRFLRVERADDPRAATVHLGRDPRDVGDLFAEVLGWTESALQAEVAEFPRPLVGHLRTGRLDAVLAPVPGHWDARGTCLMLIEDELPLFAFKFGEAVLSVLPQRRTDASGRTSFSFDESAAAERLDAEPMLAARFAEIVSVYAMTGSVVGHALGGLPGGQLDFAADLRDFLLRFVLGRGYAHLLVHAHEATPRAGMLPVPDVESLTHSWQQEFLADEISLGILATAGFGAADNIDLVGAFLGIGLYFDVVDVMDRALSLLETGEEQARQLNSHPSSDARKQRLSELLVTSAESTRPVAGAAEAQGRIIRLFWDRARPRLVELHRQGARPAPMWRTIPKENAADAARDR
ncbi:hypothetical protein [Nocardia sp. NPDC005745]|uniref:hypothetical protein n=1 Tax=Nocardia sp. NPDC005745 TaxID=3157061 RepID=UPI0034039BA5